MNFINRWLHCKEVEEENIRLRIKNERIEQEKNSALFHLEDTEKKKCLLEHQCNKLIRDIHDLHEIINKFNNTKMKGLKK